MHKPFLAAMIAKTDNQYLSSNKLNMNSNSLKQQHGNVFYCFNFYIYTEISRDTIMQA